ncbi:NACHT, LRR and PYD domains-containing protein 13 [Pteropus alecto]|uniref:NACHT, LRR and PYD domains-containing protein 13 n=1 Tax=Pteropus alecto TaxID=9402 RepID=L5KEC7_PTEAL|nr:NACHT, LRR and PYD domains-containing protein 13 [Pteropus alecto]
MGLRFLCEALSHPDCNLQNLNLFYCSFTADGCREPTDCLKHNHNVKALVIGKNCIQDDRAKQLCEILKHSHCALTHLGESTLSLCRKSPHLLLGGDRVICGHVRGKKERRVEGQGFLLKLFVCRYFQSVHFG